MNAKPVQEVAIYTTVVPDRPYVEVGIVSARAEGSVLPSRAKLIETVREEAAARGCDGLILGNGSVILAEGTCIVFK